MNINISLINQHLTDINPLICGWQSCGAGHSYGPAARDYFLIHYVMQGKGYFCHNNESYPLGRGSIFLIRPDELTYYKADDGDPWTYVWLGFDGNRCQAVLQSTLFAEGSVTAYLPEAERLFAEIMTEIDLQRSAELYLCSKLYALCAMMQPNPVQQKNKNEYVRRTVDYIKANYALPIRVDNIARMIGIDRHYLSRIFTEQMGVSPKRYLLELRLGRAASFLRERNYSVQSAARSVGYADVFNFSKVFKRYYGIPPQKYKQLRTGE